MAEPPDLRAADSDRDRVVDQLRRHLGEGRLDLAEFETRAERAYAARTFGDLQQLMSDLPGLRDRVSAGPPARVRPPRARVIGKAAAGSPGWDVAFRIHLYLWLVLSAFWIVIWVGTGGGFFWPIFPMAGFGLSVGVHAVVRKAVLDS
ncbi:MAG: DUF1707 domain-containing protein [Acidimicrobiales bacterium]